MSKICVWIKRPGEQPERALIGNTLEDLQQIVEGYIETVTISEDLVIICNEEGWIRDLPFNCRLCGHLLFGNLIFAGYDEDDFTDCPLDERSLKRAFPELWEVES